MSKCRATKRDGSPCKAPATGPDGMCWAHDEAHADERRRMASHAARAKHNGAPRRELAGVKARLSDLADAVLAGEVDRGDAAVVNQILNTLLRAISIEAKLREVEELADRLERLEALELEERSGAWGYTTD